MRILIAKAISNILSALAVIVEATFVLVYLGTKNLFLSLEWTLVSSAFILVLLTAVYYFIRKGKFSDLDVSTQKQRPLLFVLDFIFALVYLPVLYLLHAPKALFVGNIAIFAVVMILAAVNRFVKASVHMAVLSGALTLFVFIGGPLYLWGFLLIPVLAWARLTTKRHTLKEVVTGTIIGILVAAFIMVIQLPKW
jgi:membrane-associated phospholipid phosphatase